MLKLALAAALAAAASAIPSGSSHHKSTPGGTVVELRVPAGQLEAVEAISHDIWTTRYSPGNLSATHLDLNVHVAHEQLGRLREVDGAEQLGVLVDDVHTLVDAEAAKRTGEWDREASKRIIGAKRDPFFDEYRPNEVIDEYLLLLAELHPEIAEFVRAQLPFRSVVFLRA